MRAAGRPRALDALLSGIKHRAPPPLVRAAQAAALPSRRLLARLARSRRVRRALPPAVRREFLRLDAEARARWWRGERRATGEAIRLPIDRAGHGVWLRPGTSDILLYSDVVVDQQYGRVEVPNVRAIVDCGANIGLTSAYLLCKYPEARLIAVEPDPVNYELCCRNLEQFGARATVLRAAVWGAPRALRVADPAALGTWASTVAPLDGDDDGQAVEGLDLPSLFQRFHIDRVDILKIDIEGAELDVLSASDTGWIDRVRCLAIELENAASEAAFFRVMRGRPFTFTQSRDAILALRREGGA